MIRSRSLPIDRDSKANRLPVGTRTEHKMQVTSMEAKGDLAPGGLEHRDLPVIHPFAGEPPLVQSRMIRHNVEMLHI